MRGILISFCAALAALSGCVQSEKETGDDQSLTAAPSDINEQQDSVLRGFDAGPTADTEVGKLPDKPDIGQEEDIVQIAPDTVDSGSDAIVIEDSGPEVDAQQVEPDVPVADTADAPDTADSGPDTQVVGTDAIVDTGSPDVVDSSGSDAVGTVDSGPDDGSDAVDAGVDAQDVPSDVPVVDLCKNANCNDGNLCTNDSCDAKLGCQFVNNTLLCEDGNVCTEGEKCANGSCTAGPVKNCSDGNVCTADVCDNAKGCVYLPLAGSCDDGTVCTENDVCNAGVCLSGAVMNCNDGTTCTKDSCDAVTGCAHVKLYKQYFYTQDMVMPPEWVTTPDFAPYCGNNANKAFGVKCAIGVTNIPASTTSEALIDLVKVKAGLPSFEGNWQIAFGWARYQQMNTQEKQEWQLLDAQGTVKQAEGIGGDVGTIKFVKTVLTDSSVVTLRWYIQTSFASELKGSGIWSPLTVGPEGCVPPAP